MFRTTCCLLIASVSMCAAEDYWPQWRGPDGQGHSDAKDLPAKWSETRNIEWKTELPGQGWSSPVIFGNEIWMTAAVEELVDEAEKKRRLANNTGSQPLVVAGDLSLRAVCVDKTSGKLLADVELMTKQEPQPTHTLNSFASPSPILADGKLYCHFGSYGTCCFDTESRKVLWKRQDIVVAHENGPGSTPVLWKDKLIVHMDGSDEQYIIAFDAGTGETAWKTDRSGEMQSNPQLKKAYGTPLIVEIEGRDVVISPAADWVYGYDPQTGEELWKLSYGKLGFSIVPRPISGDGMFYLCTSFMRSQLLAYDYTSGKVPELVWSYDRQVANQPSPILVEGLVYTISDKGGILSCLDAKTGEVQYQQRLGGNYSSSPMYADGKIYFSNREGATAVIAPGSTYKRIGAGSLDGRIMASPVAIDGALFIRTDKALYRIGEK